MRTTSDPFEHVTYEHHAGQFVDYKPGWWVFTDMIDADGGYITMAETGPFASKEAAAICADMANAQKVEEIDGVMLRAARREYLARVMK